MSATSNIAQFVALAEDDINPEQQDLQRLASLLEKFTPLDGRFDLPCDGLHVVRASKIMTSKTSTLASTAICIVAQGAKSISIAQRDYEYDNSQMIVYAAEIPVHARITQATKEAPYLCLVIHIDPKKLAELISRVFSNGIPKTAEAQPIYIGMSNQKIVNSAIRLMEILIQQEDSDLLAPLMIDEILIRLLRSPSGPAIAQLGISDSNVYKVSKAISWLKDNYSQSVKVDQLAEQVGMSASSFHSYFKKVTTMSPLQFQKTLRLHQARNLITLKRMDVSSASYEVGYSSLSQFSREYTREFGIAPSKDGA